MEAYALPRSQLHRPSSRRRYTPPSFVQQTTLSWILDQIGQPPLDGNQMSWIASGQSRSDTHIFYSGSIDLLKSPSVAIVGARDVSDEGAARARRLARELAVNGVTVVSGLAKGVDANAHRAAIAVQGRTVAVVGTPLDQAYPAENSELQEQIAREHLLISPFTEGSRVYQSNFPKRNRVMAALTSGTVIIEASDSSGTLHQAAECERLNRWLFILRSVYDNPDLEWPRRFVKYAKCRVIDSPGDVLGVIRP